jgi:regulator of sigma E protease
MNIVAALLIFTVIVVVHEFGHFLLAKKNGVEVTEFSVGMGPRLITVCKTAQGFTGKILCSQKVFEERQDWQGITKYSWKLFPIGGSCAMVGEDMEDDSEGSFNSKGVWARFSVIFAGPFFNFLLAFVFSVIILGNAGVDVPEVVQVYAGQPGETAGIQEGDLIKSINGHHISIGREIDTYLQLHPLTGDEVKVLVERDGKEKTITIAPDYKTYLFGFNYSSEEKASTEVLGVSEDGAFEKAGIQEGDVILSVDGVDVSNAGEMSSRIEEVKSDGDEVTFVIQRDGKEKTVKVTPTPYEGKTLGFLASKDVMMGAGGVLKYSVIEVKYWIETTIASLGQLVAGKLSRNDVSGVVGIVDAVGGVIDQSVDYGMKMVIINMLYMSVLLSANLGVMNLLPLPALDGGRLVFILIEAVRGKPVDREKEGFVHIVGFILLMVLMVLIMFNDIWKIVH